MWSATDPESTLGPALTTASPHTTKLEWSTSSCSNLSDTFLSSLTQAVEYVILQVNTYSNINSTLSPIEVTILRGEAKEKSMAIMFSLRFFFSSFLFRNETLREYLQTAYISN